MCEEIILVYVRFYFKEGSMDFYLYLFVQNMIPLQILLNGETIENRWGYSLC